MAVTTASPYGAARGRASAAGRRFSEMVLYAASPLLALVTAPLLARALGPDGRGAYALCLAIYSLALSIGVLGQPEVLLAELRSDRSGFRRTAFRLGLGGACLAGVVAGVSALGYGVPVAAAAVLAASVPVGALGLLLRSELVAGGQVGSIAVQSAISAVIRLLLIVVLAIGAVLTVDSAVVATQLSVLAATGLALLAVRSRLRGPRSLDHGSGSLGSMVRAMRSGAPIVGSSITTGILLRLDVVLLAALSSQTQLGYYAAAVGFSEAGLAVSGAFKTRMQRAAFFDAPGAALLREFTIMLSVAILGGAIGYLIAPALVVGLLGAQFEPSVAMLRVLILAAIFQMVIDAAQGVLTVLGARRSVLVSSLLGAILTAGTLVVAVPVAGGLGAAWASVVAYGCAGTLMTALIVRHLRMGRNGRNAGASGAAEERDGRARGGSDGE